MRLAPDGSGIGGDRHRILRELLRELERHPIVTSARGHPPSLFTEIRAELAPDGWGCPVDDARLRITWYPADRPQFAFHYSDSTGFDCGWHREPNPHVDGWTHYQEREAGEEYAYETISFDTDTPTTLAWEVLDRLRDRLRARSP